MGKGCTGGTETLLQKVRGTVVVPGQGKRSDVGRSEGA